MNTKGYYGAVCDGRYVYFVPRFDGVHHHSRVLRYNTQGAFKSAESWCAFDAGNPVSYQNAAFDGRYIYFAPGYETGKGTHEPPGKPSALVDVRGPSGKVLRYDTHGALTDPGSYTTYDAGNTSGLDAKCYDGTVFDGRYVYFLPFWEGEDPTRSFHARVLRYDTQKDFTDRVAWEAADGAHTVPPNPGGFNGGAFDGRYVYFSPWREDAEGGIAPHGKVLRYDTSGPDASFILKYADCGHNGGLCAALPGPVFSINTATGILDVCANKPLEPGWHHIAGIYDGTRLTLFVDGVPVNQAEGTGPIQVGQADVAIGHISGGGGPFKGTISEVRISDLARSADWIRTTYENLKAPQEFVHMGEEESA